MVRKDINFAELKESIVTFLNGKSSIILATCSNNRVTARSVSFVNNGLEIFFLSWNHHTKTKQIRANENVALCISGLQVEGKATIRGNFSDLNNEMYLGLYKKKHLRYYDMFGTQPNTTLITIEPTLLIKLINIEGTFYRDHLVPAEELAYRLKIDD